MDTVLKGIAIVCLIGAIICCYVFTAIELATFLVVLGIFAMVTILVFSEK